MTFAAKNVLGLIVMQIRLFFMRLFKDERGAVTIVEMVVLIGIAVLLAVFFRGQIQNLLNTLFETINICFSYINLIYKCFINNCEIIINR